MLTRLKVTGFKNLENVDVRFGPFTCVAGPNGVGKSNLFDAIAFLSALADRPLAEAAATVRGAEGRVGSIRDLFHVAGGRQATEMSFLVEMIVPLEGSDDLGSEAKASWSFLRYELSLREREEAMALGPLEVVAERMEHITKTSAPHELRFSHKPAWLDSVVGGSRRTVPYIETKEELVQEVLRSIVLLRADSAEGKGGGRPRKLLASNLPRTVLSTANNAAEHRTLVLARKEMMGWTQIQFEPSALRSPDTFSTPPGVAPTGAHLPATLLAMGREAKRKGTMEPEDVYQQVANRLAELFENVRTLRVVEDDRREQISIVLRDLQGVEHTASSLSDGTLRFLALSILEASDAGPSLVCLEEPENGIHPARIPAMLRLLQGIAVDTSMPAGMDNPMRQVIINTHSPRLVKQVPAHSLVLAHAEERVQGGVRERPLSLQGLPDTWRAQDGANTALRLLTDYFLELDDYSGENSVRPGEERVGDREDVRQLSLFEGREDGEGA
ncbi:MAG: AAA family ATPase [Deltaproteobacteria bacterium]|nr:AAA family ATPase [Deltaproteobacteria bacterium]